MKALLAGAGGLIGKQLLKKLLEDKYYTGVEIWVRKTLGITHPKLTEKIINFSEINSMPAIEVDSVFCALGTTIKKAKTPENFRKVDLDFVISLAKYAERAKTSKFLVVSSIGANYKSKNLYLQTKGEMEKEAGKLNISSVIIFRPSLLLGKRDENRFIEKMSKFFMAILGKVLFGKLRKYRAIKDSTVAQSMINLSKEKSSGIIIYESDQIEETGNQ